MVSYYFFFVFAYGSELGMWETVMTRLRERQRTSVEVKRVVEAQLGLREWSVTKRDEESSIEVRERRESFSEIQIWENNSGTRICQLGLVRCKNSESLD